MLGEVEHDLFIMSKNNSMALPDFIVNGAQRWRSIHAANSNWL